MHPSIVSPESQQKATSVGSKSATVALSLSIGGGVMNSLGFIGSLMLMIMVGEAASEKQFYGVTLFGIVFYVVSVAVVAAGFVVSCTALARKNTKKTIPIVSLCLSIGNGLALILVGFMFFAVVGEVLSAV